jgi:serine protease Do
MTPALATATGAPAGVVVNVVQGPTGNRRAAAATAGATASNAPASSTAPSTTDVDVGDAIVAVNGQPIRSPREWQQALRARGPGATLDLTIVRVGKRMQVPWLLPRADTSSSTRAASAASAAPAASTTGALDSLGLSLRGPSSAGKGIDIIDVHAATPAARAGLRAGDVITSLPARGPATQHAIATAYTELAPGRALLLAIDRQGTPLVAAVVKP